MGKRTRRIVEMSDDIECQPLEKFKSNPCYSIQMDEFTDVSNAALLLVFVRYCSDGNIHNFSAKNIPQGQLHMK